MRRMPALAYLFLACLGALAVCSPASGVNQPEYPKPLDEGVYVSDRAVVLTIGEVTRINKAAADIFAASGVPVLVVTIRSVEDMGGDPAGGIEAYANGLFNQWKIGSDKDNRGVLVLLSGGDRKARIQLGSAWPRSQDAVTQKIMDTTMVPALQRGAFGQGLLAGVDELGAMIAESDAAGKRAPAPSPAARPSVTAPPGPSEPGPPPVVPPQSFSLLDIPLVVVSLWCVGTTVVLGVLLLLVRAVFRRGGGSSAMGYGASASAYDAWGGGGHAGGGDGGGGHGGGDGGGGGGGGGSGDGGGGGSSSGGGSTGSW